MTGTPTFNTVTTEEGLTYTPWTDGWAIGYVVTAPDGRREIIALNPSGGGFDALDATSLGDTFVYSFPIAEGVDAAGVSVPLDGGDGTVCYVNQFEIAQ